MDRFFKLIENSIGKAPIIGTPSAALILLLFGVGYMIYFVTLLTFVLLPYTLIRGIIDPEKVEGKFPFDSLDDYGMWNRVGFATVLILGYGLPLGAIIYFLIIRR